MGVVLPDHGAGRHRRELPHQRPPARPGVRQRECRGRRRHRAGHAPTRARRQRPLGGRAAAGRAGRDGRLRPRLARPAGARLRPARRPGRAGPPTTPRHRHPYRRPTDPLGRVAFTVAPRPPATPGPASSKSRCATTASSGEAHARVHVQPFDVRLTRRSTPGRRWARSDRVVLRNLFGPLPPACFLRKEFGSGLSGSRVFLVEPLLAPPHDAGGPPGEARAARPALPGEDRHPPPRSTSRSTATRSTSRTSCPPNVSRVASPATWGGPRRHPHESGGRPGLGPGRDEIDWLVQPVPTTETHHLLDDLFIRDLGRCWYANSPVAGRVPAAVPRLRPRDAGPADDPRAAARPGGLLSAAARQAPRPHHRGAASARRRPASRVGAGGPTSACCASKK